MIFLHSPNLTKFKGGIFMSQKITFLVLVLIFVFSIPFTSMAEPIIKPINTKMPTVSNSKDWVDAIYLCDNINYRSLFPMVFSHFRVLTGGKIGACLGRGTSTSNYHGLYFYYSNNFGVTWDLSTVIALPFPSFWERIYSSMAMGSDIVDYSPYIACYIRSVGEDTIYFITDTTGFGGGDWAVVPIDDNNGMGNINVVNDSMVFVPTTMAFSNDYILYYSNDYGTTWSQIYNFTPSFFAPLMDGIVAVEYDWADMSAIISIPSSGDLYFIGDIIFEYCPSGTDTITAGAFFYSVSADNGVTWASPQWVDSNIMPIGYQNEGINWAGWNVRLTSDELTSDEKIIITGVYPNDAGDEAKMFGHVYDGTSWTTTNITPPTGDSGYIWNGLGTMYSQQNGLLVDDAGNAFCIWEDIVGIEISGGSVSGVIPALVGVKYDGTSWKNIEILDTIPDFAYFNAADKVDDNGNCLIALNMYGDSLYVFSVPAPTGIAEKKHSSVSLLNITAPGLVRNSTTIRFSVSNGGYGKLDVFDMTGKLVKTLVNGNVNAGNHSVVWNRTDNSNEKVSGGVYFYKLTVGNKTVTRKIIAVK